MSAKELKHNAIGFFGSLIMAVAGAAPAYSITASTAALTAAVGIAGPAVLWFAFFPMVGIAVAFSYLNKWRSDAGAAYAWVGRSINPQLGFLVGWALLCFSTIFMVAAALPAGEATLDLIAPDKVHSVVWATGIGCLWFLGVLLIVTRGITAALWMQVILTIFELGALLLIGVMAIWGPYKPVIHPFSWSWFMPTNLYSFESFSAGMLVALFYYFGWDVAANLAEETTDAKNTSGPGGIIGVILVFLLFLLLQVAIQMTMSSETIQTNSANLLPKLGQIVLPKYWGVVGIGAVLISVVATLETQLLQCSRLLFSMARDKVIGESMGEIHPRYQTPWLAGFAVASISLLLFCASATIPTINELMSDLISAIGIQICFYYSMAAFACCWYFRRRLLSSWKKLIGAGVIPLVSGLVVAWVGCYQLLALDWQVSLLSIGSISTGLIPLYYYRWLYRSPFYVEPLEQSSF